MVEACNKKAVRKAYFDNIFIILLNKIIYWWAESYFAHEGFPHLRLALLP